MPLSPWKLLVFFYWRPLREGGCIGRGGAESANIQHLAHLRARRHGHGNNFPGLSDTSGTMGHGAFSGGSFESLH